MAMTFRVQFKAKVTRLQMEMLRKYPEMNLRLEFVFDVPELELDSPIICDSAEDVMEFLRFERRLPAEPVLLPNERGNARDGG